MPYCRNCGAQLYEEAAYCQNCGTLVKSKVGLGPQLAGWGERFVAWLIDIIIVGVLLAPIKWFFFWVTWPSIIWTPGFLRWAPFSIIGLDNVIIFLYWTIMEGTFGQSIGKIALQLKVSRLNGEPVDKAQAAIQSLGKAFLLPIDCIIGWILYPAKKQRLFNYLSATVTVKASGSKQLSISCRITAVETDL